MSSVGADHEPNPITAVRGQIARLRESLDVIDADLKRLEAVRPVAIDRVRPVRYYDLLIGVYETGRHGIDSDALAALAAVHGYDRRGLNGFFTGGRAPLRRHGDRVVLTPEGHRLIALRLEELAG